MLFRKTWAGLADGSSGLAVVLRLERPLCKGSRVRRFMDLGHTVSLEVGYELSPRGRRVLEAIDGR